jgi:hypothetical protein
LYFSQWNISQPVRHLWVLWHFNYFQSQPNWMALPALSGMQTTLFNPAREQKGYQAAASCLMSYLSSSAI